MKNKIKIFVFLLSLLSIASCSDYLDVVPDNSTKLEDFFSMKNKAIQALAKVYGYMPDNYQANLTSLTLGDEWVPADGDWCEAPRIMQGLTGSNGPRLGFWSGTGGGKNLYQGIRSANIFLQHIDGVLDMTDMEKTVWRSQVQFLKAYYHFLLLQRYGPIIISDEVVPANATGDALYQRRQKVEDCFQYILRLMDKATPGLIEKAVGGDLGQVDQVAAKAIKARMLVFRASPFFNGNREYYGNFLDSDNQPFFPPEYDKEKWKEAIDALNEAINICKANGIDLYKFEGTPYSYDSEDYKANPNLKTLYDLRMLIADPWNKELIWGDSNIFGGESLSEASQMRLPPGYDAIGASVNSSNWAWDWMGASYMVASRYYTKNGLPIDEDRTFNTATMYDEVSTPAEGSSEYLPLQGFMQPSVPTAKFYMDREPRLYANLGINGGYWRGQTVRIRTMMYSGTVGGYNDAFQSNYYLSGIACQKFVNPESKSEGFVNKKKFPYPIIRLSDLYLMKAEALNEYAGPSPEVYGLLNLIRERAGIPKVEEVWSNPTLAKNPGKHTTQDGLREIILRERANEFAFEGIRFWDVIRHKKALTEFNTPLWGWSARYGTTPSTFFVLAPANKTYKFLIRDYLTPIDLNEMNTNPNLIQNPEW
ncbi:starch-binding protein [Bacteroidia bacterium]|nr:starch-binding protein [Bacteroidia bacterium]